jgi:hypothetical protein
MTPSTHFVKNVNIYKESFIKGFSQFYGDIQDYIVIGLLPNYIEREGSSLIYMVEDLIKKSKHEKSGFFLNEFEEIETIVNEYQSTKNNLIIGASYALLDFYEKKQTKFI